MRRLLLLLLAATVVSACSAASSQKSSRDNELQTLTPAQVQAKLQAHEPMFLFDDNSDERYAQGHVPTAKHLKVDDVTTQALPADKAAMLVFYCSSDKCSACHHAAEAAIALGYSNVWIMPEGIKGWEANHFAQE